MHVVKCKFFHCLPWSPQRTFSFYFCIRYEASISIRYTQKLLIQNACTALWEELLKNIAEVILGFGFLLYSKHEIFVHLILKDYFFCVVACAMGLHALCEFKWIHRQPFPIFIAQMYLPRIFLTWNVLFHFYLLRAHFPRNFTLLRRNYKLLS